MHEVRQRLRYMVEQAGYYPLDAIGRRSMRKVWLAIAALAILDLMALAHYFLK